MREAKSKSIIPDLKARFLDGDKLTVEEIIKEYFDAKNPYAYLILKARVNGWLNYLKTWFRKEHGLWFGSLGDHRYGMITEESEVKYAMLRYYRLVKGNLFNARLLVQNASDSKILPQGITTERLLVSRVLDEKEKDEK